MALYPGANVRLISKSYLSGLGMTAYNRINHHVAAGYGSLFNFFNQPKRASSHFWVAKDGRVEQYVDTALRAEADLHGNDATISIETESKGEAWTPAQAAAIIALDIWLCDTHGIAKRLAVSSKLGEESKGLSWHRLGINGNFPALPSRYAGRLQRGGGMQYSLSGGKTCPVEPCIDQIFDVILPGVLGGAPAPQPPTPQPPTPQPPQPTGLEVDGRWGAATTTRLQQYFGTPVDGVMSHQWWSKEVDNLFSAQFDKTKAGSTVARALQGKIGAGQDGLFGSKSVTKLQQYLGTPVDGNISNPSAMVSEMQRRLNANNL